MKKTIKIMLELRNQYDESINKIEYFIDCINSTDDDYEYWKKIYKKETKKIAYIKNIFKMYGLDEYLPNRKDLGV